MSISHSRGAFLYLFLRPRLISISLDTLSNSKGFKSEMTSKTLFKYLGLLSSGHDKLS